MVGLRIGLSDLKKEVLYILEKIKWLCLCLPRSKKSSGCSTLKDGTAMLSQNGHLWPSDAAQCPKRMEASVALLLQSEYQLQTCLDARI